jgi:TPR repeat protein
MNAALPMRDDLRIAVSHQRLRARRSRALPGFLDANLLGSPFVPLLRSCRAALVAAPFFLALMISALPAEAGIEAAVKALQADDMPTAEKELQLLAKERDPRAEFLLGFYVYGNPQSKLFDLVKGAPLLLDAAERGYTPAMIPLAGCYADGKGVPKSFFEAYKWMLIAERWNVPVSGPLVEQVAHELKSEEIEKAKAEAIAYVFKTK